MGGSGSKDDVVVTPVVEPLDEEVREKWWGRREDLMEHLFEKCKLEPFLPVRLAFVEVMEEGDARYAQDFLTRLYETNKVERSDAEGGFTRVTPGYYWDQIEIFPSRVATSPPIVSVSYECHPPSATVKAEPRTAEFLLLRAKNFARPWSKALKGSHGIPFLAETKHHPFRLRPE